MGQKVNPIGMRIGITATWPSAWYASKAKFKQWLLEDTQIRRFIKKRIPDAGISLIEINRTKKTSILIHTSKPGVVIGKQGAAIEDLRKDMERKFGGSFEVNIREIRNPDADAVVIAEAIRGQIERRMPYRRAAKMAIEKAIQAGAVGIKIRISGRLNGVEIAREVSFKEGNIPLHTLRTNVQFAVEHAHTNYGTIGVQVWVYKGMVFKKIKEAEAAGLPAGAN